MAHMHGIIEFKSLTTAIYIYKEECCAMSECERSGGNIHVANFMSSPSLLDTASPRIIIPLSLSHSLPLPFPEMVEVPEVFLASTCRRLLGSLSGVHWMKILSHVVS